MTSYQESSKPSEQFDLLLTAKILIIGDENAGKTSITRRYCHGLFDEGRSMTSEVSNYTKLKVMS